MSLSAAPTRLVKWLAFASGVSVRQAHNAAVMRILMFHGVGDRAYPAEVFDRQLAWLKANFEVVSLKALVYRLQHDARPTGREIVLTFDDGLENNASIVAPLLARHDLPATFFLCPGLIEDEAWIWNVEARERLLALLPGPFEELREALGVAGTDDASDEEAVEHVVAWMKTLAVPDRLEAEAAIRSATEGWTPTDEQRLANDMMTWRDVARLDPRLITIGSHTVHHPTLTTLEQDDLRYEVIESRRLLEQRINRPVDLFCYPSGIEDDRVRDLVAETYEAAVTVESGTVVGDEDVYRLPRVGAVPSGPRLAWRLNRP
ncbi:MAG: polysaccharide deacetylase family protein [Planctomycetota bacterium]|nr:polysaccharide deacetylase family protein [Planctomycetota bacterium]